MTWKQWSGWTPGRFLLCSLLLGALLSGSMAAWAADPRPGGDLIQANSFDRPTRSVGGSNYLWHDFGAGCSREPYGLVPTYHIGSGAGSTRSRARQQLAQMYADGMRRLSLGVFFKHADSSGTVIDSSDPAQVAQAVSNIASLMADVKAAGFHEVLFRFFPVGDISPSHDDFRSNLIDEYWDLIVGVRPALVAAGLPYRIDLMVEGMPRDRDLPIVSDPWNYPTNEKWSRAVRTLWRNYTADYGRSDTVGFSYLIDSDADRLRTRVRHMRYVYEGNYPYLFAADFYADGAVSEADKFIALHAAMVKEDSSGNLGWKTAGWIIAESFHDDPFAAEGLASAIAATRRTVYYLTQWPQDRAAPVCSDVNVGPPYAWDVFGAYGF